LAEYRAANPSSADLAACLALGPSPEADLRHRLLAGGWKPVIELAGDLRLLPALAVAAGTKGLTAGIPALRAATGQASVPLLLADALEEHDRRAAVMRDRLGWIVDILSARGLRPVLLKGARPLWTGTPRWRTLRDLDLLVGPPGTKVAIAAALAAGFRPNESFNAPAGWHHDAELYHDDLPGWLEIHERVGVRRMEVILPTARLVDAAEPLGTTPGGSQVLALPLPFHILSCLMHHHIGHRGDYYDMIDFKGLYEFAADVAALEGEGREALLAAARQHPRLIAMLDLWLAAAADVFRLPIREPLRVAPDAERHWKTMRAHAADRVPPTRFAGLAREVAMALDRRRLTHVAGGENEWGRLRLRAKAVRAIVTRAAVG
jgi:hypothetical protein